MKKYIFCVLFCMVHHFSLPVQDTGGYRLEHFVQIAQRLPELPPCDTLTWTDPDYSSFLKSISDGYYKSFLYAFGILDKTSSVVQLFIDLLSDFKDVPARTENSRALCLDPESQVYVWGDLHGSFHTLLKSVVWLQQQGVIDDYLKIENVHTHFIIFGDAISRGPYSMATLALILALMKKNPAHVHYIKGNHEQFKYWENFGLKREIAILVDSTYKSIEKTKQLVNCFFATLPEYLLVRLSADPDSLLLYAFNGIKYPYVCPSKPLPKMVGMADVHITCAAYRPADDKEFFIPDLIFKTEEWREGQRTQSGLGIMNQIFGATTWSIFSSPIQVHRDLYNFSKHAFSNISFGKSMRTSAIACITQAEKNVSFVKQESLNLVTGRTLSSAQPEPVGDDILIGSTMPLMQGLPVVSGRTRNGVNSAIIDKNINGGIRGRHIKFDLRNDNYVPFVARKNIDDLRMRGIDIILAPVGSATLKSYTDLVMNESIAVLFPVTGNTYFCNPSFKNLISLTAMYPEEITALLKFLIKHQAVRHFCFIYQEDEYGKETLDKIDETLTAAGITSYVSIPYSRGSIDFKNQSEKIKNQNIEAIGFLCTPQAAQEFIRKLDVETLNNKTIFGLSMLTSGAFKSFLYRKGLRFFFSCRVPNPITSQLPIVGDYKVLMDRFHYPLDSASLEGYLAARLLFDVLEANPFYTNKQDLIESLRKIKEYDFGGLSISYKPSDSSFNLSVWTGVDSDETWFETPAHSIF